jgi:hypothetical protein
LIPFHIVLKFCPGQNRKCTNEQRAITPKIGIRWLLFLFTSILRSEIIYVHSFKMIPVIVLKLNSRKILKCKNEQRAITSNLGKAELWFFCTAFLVNEIYIPTNFIVNTFRGLSVMSRKSSKCKN